LHKQVQQQMNHQMIPFGLSFHQVQCQSF
jgi:hypothetical protein